MKKWIYGKLLEAAYALRLRYPAIWVQRWWTGELNAPRKPLPRFDTPEELAAYGKARFRYRYDTGKLRDWRYPLDWVTDPEVFQARLENAKDLDGDCDDIHWWAACCLAMIPAVGTIYLVSSGFNGGGHTTCVFRYQGTWHHLDYKLYPIADPNDVPLAVAKRYTRGDRKVDVPWYVFERQDKPWQAVAIGPHGRVPA